jgi:hypothetical protein
VAVLAVVLAFFQLKDSVLGSASTGSSGSSDPGPDDQQSAAPTAPVTTSPTTKPTATSTASPSSPSSSATSVAPSVNRKATVTVLNSTSRSGLAKSAAGKLSGAGWRASSGGNQSFSGSTTVFYTQDRLKATAQAIAKDLGGYPVKQSTAYGSSGVFVILAGDYPG